MICDTWFLHRRIFLQEAGHLSLHPSVHSLVHSIKTQRFFSTNVFRGSICRRLYRLQNSRWKLVQSISEAQIYYRCSKLGDHICIWTEKLDGFILLFGFFLKGFKYSRYKERRGSSWTHFWIWKKLHVLQHLWFDSQPKELLSYDRQPHAMPQIILRPSCKMWQKKKCGT